MHAIDQSLDDQGSMVYVGSEGKPWHTLGYPIEQGASVEVIKKTARLGWKVLRRPVIFQVNDTTQATDEGHNVIFRSDTLRVLDVTGPDYIPSQNDEVLEFFREYLDAGEMFIDTAGSLNNGQQIWVQAKLDKSFQLPGKDVVQGRLLLMNPHQYGKGMIAKFVAERVVCWNTLTMALGEGGKSVKIWHTHEFNKARRQEAKEKLGIARERFDAIKQDAQTLVKTVVSMDEAVSLIAEIMGQDPKKPLEQQNRAVTRMVQLFGGAGKGADLASAKGTAWGVLNAVTQYVDHEYGRTPDSRMTNAWLGTGDVQKRRALVTLLAASKAGSN